MQPQENKNAIPKVCFAGRPNVGKSSLFNRLLGRKKAIVLDKPGVTRDVSRASVDWDGAVLELADLAGLETFNKTWDRSRSKSPQSTREEQTQILNRLAKEAALEYMNKSDLILFVIDGRSPLTPADEELALAIRRSNKPVLVVLSKIEGRVEDEAQAEAARLGLGEGIPTSAEHNLGIETLKEKVLEIVGVKKSDGEEDVLEEVHPSYLERGQTRDNPLQLGVYGRPNVGKSTLVNQLLGENRMITSPIAGTTVDTVDTDFVYKGKFYRILDTAGIRRKSKTERGVEVLSVVQALKSVQEVDVALLMLDGYEGVTDQDEKIVGELVRTGKPVALIVNKWDLCRVDRDEYAERLRETLGFIDYAPILFISAEKGQGLGPLWDLVTEIMTQRQYVAPTAELNKFMETVEGTNNPMNVRLFYASQTSTNPPTITCLVNNPNKVHFAYERFLKNELRKRFGWMGSPLRMVFKARTRSPSKKANDRAGAY